jgi:predicted Fe-S protein YdhL (DUF1289 family)
MEYDPDDVWAKPTPTPIDPCTRQCGVSSSTGLCRGCFRKLDEIAKWDQMDDAARIEVLEAVSERKAKAAALLLQSTRV